MHHYTDGGLRNVWLRNGYELHETPYGKAVSIQDGDGLIRATCLALTHKVGRLTRVEFRYIRASGFLMSQPSLAKLVGADGQTVARWEKSGKIPKWADKLVRLLYAALVDGHEIILPVVAHIEDVDHPAIRTSHWRPPARGGKPCSRNQPGPPKSFPPPLVALGQHLPSG